jgi:hypothetical protein
MAAWTAATGYGYTHARRRGWPLLIADLVLTAACVMVSPWVLGADGLNQGFATLPAAWIAGPVLAWAISGGRRRGAVAAILLAICDQGVRGQVSANSLDGNVLMLLAAIAVGHVTRLAVEAQERLQRATELEAANRERERLARGIHDSVLQVLALVQRRGAELGGDAAELGRLAGEQEAALLTHLATATVSLATPAHPAPLPAHAAREDFLEAVRRAADGDAVFTPGLAGLVLGEYRRLATAPKPDTDAPRLTERETEIRWWRRVCPTNRSPSVSWCRTAPCRTTSRTRWASCSCTTGWSWSGTRSSAAWTARPELLLRFETAHHESQRVQGVLPLLELQLLAAQQRRVLRLLLGIGHRRSPVEELHHVLRDRRVAARGFPRLP